MSTRKYMASIVGRSGGLFSSKLYATSGSASKAIKALGRKHLSSASKASGKTRRLLVRDVYSRKRDNIVFSKSGTYSSLLELK